MAQETRITKPSAAVVYISHNQPPPQPPPSTVPCGWQGISSKESESGTFIEQIPTGTEIMTPEGGMTLTPPAYAALVTPDIVVPEPEKLSSLKPEQIPISVAIEQSQKIADVVNPSRKDFEPAMTSYTPKPYAAAQNVLEKTYEQNKLNVIGAGAGLLFGLSQTPAGIKSFVENPLQIFAPETYASLGEGLRYNPAVVVGQLGGQMLFFKGVGSSVLKVKTPKITEAYTQVIVEPTGDAATARTLFVTQTGKKVTAGRVESQLVSMKQNNVEAVIADHNLHLDHLAKTELKRLSTFSVNVEPVAGTTLAKTYQVEMPKFKSTFVSESVVKLLSEEPSKIGTLTFKPEYSVGYEGTSRYLGMGAELPSGKSKFFVDVFRRAEPKNLEYIVGASKTPYNVEMVKLPEWFGGRLSIHQIAISKESQFAASAHAGFEGFKSDIIAYNIPKQKTFVPAALSSLLPREKTFNELPNAYGNVGAYYQKQSTDIWSKMKSPIAARMVQEYEQPTTEKRTLGYVSVPKPLQITAPKIIVAELVKPVESAGQLERQLTRPVERQLERQLTRTIFKPAHVTMPNFTMLPPMFAVPFMPLIPSHTSGKKGFLGIAGFQAWIKENGSWKPLAGIFSRQGAMGKGAKYTEHHAARSFKVVPSHVLVTRLDKSDYTFNPSKYYSKKNVYVEKPKFAINTFGELMGISAKGWRANKKKRSWVI